MGAAKYWLIFLMLAMAIVVGSGTVPFDDPVSGTWSLTGDHIDNNGFDFESEMLMDSETNHRLLAQRGRYISYGALRKDSVPCNRRGSSYYNCNGRQRANPYRRGCTAITRCKRVTN